MSFVSTLPQGTIEITDKNFQDYSMPVAYIDEHGGRVSDSGYISRDFEEQPRGSVPEIIPFPDELLIPRDEWKERIEEKERKKQRLTDKCLAAGDIWLNQKPSWYCWCYCVVQGTMAALIEQGDPARRLVPESVAGPIMGYRKKGSWPSKAVEYAARHGIADDTAWMWESHSQANSSRYFQGSRENASLTKPHKWCDVVTFEQKASLLLRNAPIPSGYGWMGHAMCSADLVIMSNGAFGCLDIDSYARHGRFNTQAIQEDKADGEDMIGLLSITPSGELG